MDLDSLENHNDQEIEPIPEGAPKWRGYPQVSSLYSELYGRGC